MSNFAAGTHSSFPSARSGFSGFPSAPEYAFAAKLDNAKLLVTILSTIQVKPDSGDSQMVVVQLTERGMKVTYEQSRAFQGL